jgi:nicotinate dehydrogenase subunit B
MNNRASFDDASLVVPEIEPERYELVDAFAALSETHRRGFLKIVGGGIVVCALLRSAPAAQGPGQGRQRGGGRGGAPDIGAWLHIGDTSGITVYTGKVEIGQNIRTSLSQVVAEELRVPLDRIELVMADTERTPFDAGTFGSQTTPVMARQLRRVASAARELLFELAADAWKCDRGDVALTDGLVVRKSTGESVEFGALTKGQKVTKAVPENTSPTPVDNWQVAGHSVAKVNGRSIVTGQHRYASDVRLPDMLHAKVLRAPSYGATAASIDTSGTDAVPGVHTVSDGSFVAVAAATEWAAARAIDAIKAEWNTTPQISHRELFDQLRKASSGGAAGAQGGRGGGVRSGSIDDGLGAADVKLDQSYTIAYIAHAPLEPRAAVAQWQDGKLTVWTGTQRPFGVRGELASALKVSEDSIRVIVPDTGSGYGGKHNGEAAIEAARIARAVGKPVKLVWTREEEFTWAYFRPAGVIDVKSGVKKDGTLTAWEFHNYNSGGSSIRTLYRVPNQLIEFHPARAPLRQGSYRALAATANHFARETHMDELAHAIGVDPLEFRLKNLEDARLRAVLEAAASHFGWGGAKPPPDHGVGIAGGSEKGSYVATCAEVRVEPGTGRVKVVRATSAFECGAILNPDHLKNQIEGAMVMGLGGALFEAIQFEDGKILNPRFSRYRVPRFGDAPEIEVVLVDRKDLPSAGAGETPIVGIAPAVGNAIFAATGVRLRGLPMAPQGVKA